MAPHEYAKIFQTANQAKLGSVAAQFTASHQAIARASQIKRPAAIGSFNQDLLRARKQLIGAVAPTTRYRGLAGAFTRGDLAALANQAVGSVTSKALLGQMGRNAFLGACLEPRAGQALRNLVPPELFGQARLFIRPAIAEMMSSASKQLAQTNTSTLGIIRQGEPWRRLFQQMDELDREFEAADPCARRLTVVLKDVGFGRAMRLKRELIRHGPGPLIDLLEEILLEPDALAAFEEELSTNEVIDPDARKDLRHGFAHLHKRELHDAFPPLINGLEGALHSAAYSCGHRRPYGNARGVVDAMDGRDEIDHDHALLLTHLYGRHNRGRHGRRTDRRTASILCLVGTMIWLEEFAKKPTLSWMGRQLDSRLMERAEGGAV